MTERTHEGSEVLVPDPDATDSSAVTTSVSGSVPNTAAGSAERHPNTSLRRWLIVLAVGLGVMVLVNALLAGFLLGFVQAQRALPEPRAQGEERAAQPPAVPGEEPAAPLVTDRIAVGESDDTNDFIVTVDAVEFRRTGTRLWLSVENRRSEPVQFMAGVTAMLLDEEGQVYRVDPFKGSHPFWGAVPAGGKESGWLEFATVPQGAQTLRLVVPDVFTLSVPAWTVEIEFAVPAGGS